MQYHLKFWQAKSGELSRIYVNADDRSSLGYFEKRVREFARGRTNYYDRHRIAKGDTTDCEITYSSTVTAEAVAKIETAIRTVPGYEKLSSPVDFENIQAFARGVDWCCAKARKAALKKQAEAFVVEV